MIADVIAFASTIFVLIPNLVLLFKVKMINPVFLFVSYCITTKAPKVSSISKSHKTWTGSKHLCASRSLQHQHRLHAPCLCPRCSSAQLLSRQDSHWGLSSHKLPSYSYSYKTIIGKARTSFNCSRYMEIRIVVLDSLKIVSMNVLFRFFYVVHADKGLVVGNYLYVGFLMSDQVGGKTNTRLAHGLYAMLR